MLLCTFKDGPLHSGPSFLVRVRARVVYPDRTIGGGGSMLNAEDNALLTRVGPNTPMGEYLRRYWVPALLSEEVPTPDCPPARVRILGETLIAFRDTDGQRWPARQLLPPPAGQPLLRQERGARPPLRLSRLEVRRERQLRRHALRARGEQLQGQGADHRLPLRGARWRCLGLHGPARPQAGAAEPRMGGSARTDNRFLSKCLQDCNWLQALEGGIDSSHISFLHSSLKPADYALNVSSREAAEAPPCTTARRASSSIKRTTASSSARAATPTGRPATTGASPRGCSPTQPSSRPRPTP